MAGDLCHRIVDHLDRDRVGAQVDRGGRIVPRVRPIQRQDGVVADGQPVGRSDRDAMGMAVEDHVLLDQDVAVEHLGPGQPLVDDFVAHEDRLGPVALPHVQDVFPDRDVGVGIRRSASPELDHVAVIAGVGRALEIVKMVLLDQDVLDLGEIHPVRAQRMDVVAGDRDVLALYHRESAVPGRDLVVFQVDPVGAGDDQRGADGIAVVDRGQIPGHVAVEHGIADGDIAAARYRERRHPERIALGIGVIEGEAVQHQVVDALETQARQRGRRVRIRRLDRERLGILGRVFGPLSQRQVAIVPGRQFDRVPTRRLCERIIQLRRAGNRVDHACIPLACLAAPPLMPVTQPPGTRPSFLVFIWPE